MAVHMASRLRLGIALVLCVAASCTLCRADGDSPSPAGHARPLVRRPAGRRYKTVLSLDGGGVRAIIQATVLVEVEQAIKRYLLEHPEYLPVDVKIATADDFDINLADYFDCMTGWSAGGWSSMYLASRGGKGADRAVLDDPAIVEKYGVIPSGGAEGLRVFYKEYSSVIYPQEVINTTAGTPLDITNPLAPGVAAPLYPLDGLEEALQAFVGKSTLEDLDTSVLVPALDLPTGLTIYFVQNTFKDPPATSSATLFSRAAPRPLPTNDQMSYFPDFVFDEGKDYYLSDIGAATGALPIVHPAKPMTQAGSDTVEFLLIDGVIPVESTELPAVLFVARESGLFSIEEIAVLSIGNGHAIRDLTSVSNAGVAGWLEGLTLPNLYTTSGSRSLTGLVDFMFYSNPRVKPNQYLKIQTEASAMTEEGMLLSVLDQPTLVDALESIGAVVVEAYRPSIDFFVNKFIFG